MGKSAVRVDGFPGQMGLARRSADSVGQVFLSCCVRKPDEYSWVMSANEPTNGPESGAVFPATRWSLVVSLKDEHQREMAINDLCAIYWNPLYAYLRRLNESPEDAKDLVQGFLARIAHAGYLEALDRDKGRFKTWLLTSLRNYLINQKERARVQRRGGGKTALSLDGEEAERFCAPELVDGNSPEDAYDKNWCRVIMARATERLREEHRIKKKEAVYSELIALIDGADAGEIKAVAVRLGKSITAVRAAASRFRARFRELLLAEAAETVGSRDQAREELRLILESTSRR